ncbi:hypothetical protein ACM66B_006243 [Microbotryomycetes sp. NB124-2]
MDSSETTLSTVYYKHQPPSNTAILVALAAVTLASIVWLVHSLIGLTSLLRHPIYSSNALIELVHGAMWSSPTSILANNNNNSFGHKSATLSSTSSRRNRKPVNPHKLARHATTPLTYPGLLNAAGNLCFLNATLQSLASLPPLIHFLAHIPSDLEPTPVSDSLLATLDAINTPSPRPAPLRPVQLASALANSSKQRRRLLNSSEQQDAHELCTMIREAVDEELVRIESNRIKRAHDGLAQIVDLLDSDCSSNSSSSSSTAADADTSTVGDSINRQARPSSASPLRNPWRLLTSQRIKCMTCGYTRDVRHIEDEQVPLQVPPVAHCSLYDLLQEHTKVDLLSDYVCRKCSVTATLDKLAAQRDRLALTNAQPAASDKSSNLGSNGFNLLTTDASTTTTTTTKPSVERPNQIVMTSSRKDRKRKVQKTLDKLKAVTEASDFERELSREGIKVENVSGPAGKQTKFARTPEILTIHLSRSVHYGRAGAFKNTCVVSFPEFLDLSPFCDYSSSSSSSSSSSMNQHSTATLSSSSPSSSRDLFRLSSLVVHYGSHQFGHYVAFRRAPHSLLYEDHNEDEDDHEDENVHDSSSSTLKQVTAKQERKPQKGQQQPEWYRISDETVEPSSLEEVLRANPVLMFYERVGGARLTQRIGAEKCNSEARDGGGGVAEEKQGNGSTTTIPRVIERWRIK